MTRRLIIGISGASGTVYGVRLLEALRETEIETHLVISEAAEKILALETDYTAGCVHSLARAVHDPANLGAAIASGSFETMGMIVAPCSIKTLSGIAHSYNDNLLIRAADVTLKERRKLVLLIRETPFHQGHLRLMLQATEMGAVIMPPSPSFYDRPRTIADLIDQSVGRALDFIGIRTPLFRRWSEEEGARAEALFNRRKAD